MLHTARANEAFRESMSEHRAHCRVADRSGGNPPGVRPMASCLAGRCALPHR